MKRVLWMTWRVFIGIFAGVLIYGLLAQPLARGWRLHHQLLSALDDASSVQVVEHSDRSDKHYSGPDYKEKTYATISLSTDQIQQFREALPITLDYSGTAELMCIFQEHHYIKIVQRDGPS